MPVATLPVIAAVLGAFYEADNTPAPEGEEKGGAAKGGKDAAGKKVRVAESKKDAVEDEELLEAPAKRSKK